VRQVGNQPVAQHRVALHDQHPRGIARARRAQRDAGSGKFEVEEIGTHAHTVIAGLDPAIHPLHEMDARVKPRF
jgi:hypothetical protein